MSSPSLLLRAVGAAAARRSRPRPLAKSPLFSTLSFRPLQLEDARRDATDAPKTNAPRDDATSNSWKAADRPSRPLPTMSRLSNAMATALSGESALAAVERTLERMEGEEGRRWEDVVEAIKTTAEDAPAGGSDDLSIWQISTLKRRKKMMNKHKLRKRRKKNRLKTRK
mmetsp:Transcript_53453/g.113537  ORF Transcript_53453/g.113537 Transcript_53453/m.113537 type:complete len:169 (+) Transcript_53453:111-617(+)